MYGLKNEVAFHATPPYCCVAVSPHCSASKHDNEIHKLQFHRCLDYLLKMCDKGASASADATHQHWAILVYLGYIGPAHHTLDVQHVTPIKAPHSLADYRHNEDVANHCVWVECFFGHLTAKFKIMCDVYQWSHDNFDDLHYDLPSGE